ncbi:MAG TPA: serine hydrolase [Bryobacteraceae bacterium]|nr:serine hydrolase [Bryobacteraceae bacterium]
MRAVLILLITGALASGQTPIDLLEEKTRARISKLDQVTDGVIGLYARDLITGRAIEYHAGVIFPQASSIKIAILIELFYAVEAGKIRLEDEVTLSEADSVGGSGKLRELLKPGASHKLTIRELAVTMMRDSDNTSTNKLISMLGIEAINNRIQSFGLKTVKLQRKMIDVQAASADRENVGSPEEMAKLIEVIWRGQAVNQKASSEMLEILKLVPGDIRKSVPAGVPVALKTGGLAGVHTETAVVMLQHHPYALSLASSFLGSDVNPLPEMARIIYEHFEKLEHSNSFGNRVR